jgi:regulator of replication initiation timing
LDANIIFDQFSQIEQKVESLIKACKTLESENVELNNRLMRLEEDLQAKVAIVNDHAREKDMIRARIDSLLLKLGEITEG